MERDELLAPLVRRIVGVLTIVSIVALVLFGLWGAPTDEVQGDAQRVMYLHVPSAWLAYLAFFITASASGLFLLARVFRPKTRSEVWDRLAGASAELGVMFTGLALVLGSIWGRPVWGFWWAWDARLVSTALLFFLFLGYCALRRIPSSDPNGAAKRNAIAALIAFVDVPIVHFSVEWWRTLHQKATVFNPQLNPQIQGVMGLTLWIGVIAFTLLYVYLLDRRYRLAVLEDGRADVELADAIAERTGAKAEVHA